MKSLFSARILKTSAAILWVLYGSIVFAQKPQTVNEFKTSQSLAKPISSNQNLPRWEFRTAPLAYWAKWQTLDASYRFTEKWSAGPAAVIYDGSETGVSYLGSRIGSAFGFNVFYNLNPAAKESWYLSSHTYYERYSAYAHARSGHQENDGFRSNLVFGRQVKLFWPQLLLTMGLGLEHQIHNVINKYVDSDTEVPSNKSSQESKTLPCVELKIGIQI